MSTNAFPDVVVLPTENPDQSLFKDGESNDRRYWVVDIETDNGLGVVGDIGMDKWAWQLNHMPRPDSKTFGNMSDAVNALLIAVFIGKDDE
jgi:hypothetical protein